MAGARRASCGGHTPSACESGEPAEARGLGHQLQADTREQAVLLSGPPAEAFLLLELLLAPVLGARRAGSLSFGNDRDCEGYHTNPRQSSFRTFSCGKANLHRFSNTALGRRPSSATSDPPPILGKLPHLRGPHCCHLSGFTAPFPAPTSPKPAAFHLPKSHPPFSQPSIPDPGTDPSAVLRSFQAPPPPGVFVLGDGSGEQAGRRDSEGEKGEASGLSQCERNEYAGERL